MLTRFQVNRILVIKFLWSQKLYADFQLCVGSMPLTPVLFKGQLYINFLNDQMWNKLKATRTNIMGLLIPQLLEYIDIGAECKYFFTFRTYNNNFPTAF